MANLEEDVKESIKMIKSNGGYGEIMKIDRYKNLKASLVGLSLGFSLSLLIVLETVRYYKYEKRCTPEYVITIQEGYAVPAKLKLKTIDLDRDGKNQTIVRYDNHQAYYHLKFDGNELKLVPLDKKTNDALARIGF